MRRDLRLVDNRALQSAIDHANLPTELRWLLSLTKTSSNGWMTKPIVAWRFYTAKFRPCKKSLKHFGGQLMVGYGDPKDVWNEWMEAWKAQDVELKSVHVGRDYEPYAQQRDRSMADFFRLTMTLTFKGVKDSVILEKNEVTKDDGKPYTVFTPYSRKWRKILTTMRLRGSALVGIGESSSMDRTSGGEIPTLASMGFEACPDLDDLVPPRRIETDVLDAYGAKRDFPAIPGTSRLSLHLRFGTIGIRQALRAGLQHSEKWTTELIWRDFYQMIIYHFPHSVEGSFPTGLRRHSMGQQ